MPDVSGPDKLLRLADIAENDYSASAVYRWTWPVDLRALANAWKREQADALRMHACACELWEELVVAQARIQELEADQEEVAGGGY
jgi:hypothetical protein